MKIFMIKFSRLSKFSITLHDVPFCYKGMSYTYIKIRILDPVIGKQLSCRKDRHNVHDVYVVAVVEGDAVASWPCPVALRTN